MGLKEWFWTFNKKFDVPEEEKESFEIPDPSKGAFIVEDYIASDDSTEKEKNGKSDHVLHPFTIVVLLFFLMAIFGIATLVLTIASALLK